MQGANTTKVLKTEMTDLGFGARHDAQMAEMVIGDEGVGGVDKEHVEGMLNILAGCVDRQLGIKPERSEGGVVVEINAAARKDASMDSETPKNGGLDGGEDAKIYDFNAERKRRAAS